MATVGVRNFDSEAYALGGIYQQFQQVIVISGISGNL
jgi:hypothetical protein